MQSQRLIPLPEGAFNRSPADPNHPTHHLAAFLAAQGITARVGDLRLGTFDYGSLRSAVVAWLKAHRLPGDTDLVPMPKWDRRVPRGYVIVQADAVQGEVAP